jgi:hydroxymethylglutaryl-CoA reductase
MTLHARNVAISAGASPAEVDLVVARLVEAGAVRQDRAEAVLAELRG